MCVFVQASLCVFMDLLHVTQYKAIELGTGRGQVMSRTQTHDCWFESQSVCDVYNISR